MLTGIYGQPLESLKNILAQCESFQTFVGVETPDNPTPEEIAQAIADTKEFIILILKGNTLPVYALIHWKDDGMSFTRSASGSGSAGYDGSKQMEIVLAKSFDDYQSELEGFANAGSAIALEILDLANDGVNYPVISTLAADKIYRGEDGDDTFYFPLHITLGI